MRLELARIRLGALGGAHQRAKPPHIAQDPVDGAMIADPDLDAALDQRLRDVGLDVGEADDEVRLAAREFGRPWR